MRTKLWLLSFVIAMLFTSNAVAGSYYPVKGGDKLIKIAKDHGTTVEEIKAVNPQIKDINQIKVGWKLEIPNQKPIVVGKEVKKNAISVNPKNQEVIMVGPNWDNPGENRYLDDLRKGLRILGYSWEIQDGLIEAVKSGKFEFGVISHKDNGGLVRFSDDSAKFRMVKMLSGGGKSPIKVLTGPDGVVPSWKDSGKSEAGRIYAFKGHYLLLPFVCENPTFIVRMDEPPVVVTGPPSITENPPSFVPIPPIGKNPSPDAKHRDNGDLYFGYGNYQNPNEASENHGAYWWEKGRYRPFWFDPEKNGLGIKSFGLGFVEFLAGGNGIAAKYYKYNWSEATVGGTLKVYAKHSDYDFDVMWGKLWNEGGWKGALDNKQVDDILLLSAHGNFYREDPTAEWFRKFELNLEYRIPIHTDVEKGTKTDNRYIEFSYVQWIKKIQMFENDALVVSPGFNFIAGYEWSADDQDYVKIGPAFEFSSHDNVVGEISLWNYKFQGDGQWHPFSCYISPDGVYNAWYAAGITEVSQEDLRGLQGQDSKLLANPADYLK